MTTLLIEHNVKDFRAWKTAFDAHADVRQKHKLTGNIVYQRFDNPNAVCVVCEGASNNIQAFIADPSLKAAMQGAGVQGEPNFRILEPSASKIHAI